MRFGLGLSLTNTFRGVQKLKPQAEAFIEAVLADGGFVVAKSHITQVFQQQEQADLICPMAGGKVGKLYFWINED